MKSKLFKSISLLTTLLVLGCLQRLPTAAAEGAAEGKTPQGEARKPAANKFDKQRHDEIMAAPGRDTCPLVFIGDSITFGWTTEKGGQATWDKEYAPMKALNLGVVCDTTENVLWRLEQGDLDGMKNVKVIVLMIGTNDIGLARRSGEDAAAGVTAVVANLKEKAPQARILLMAVTPKGRGQDRVETANKIICKLHDGKQVFYQDISEALRKTPDCIADRVGHLTSKGFEVWAEETRPTLKKLME